jgi:hypothetical protein
MKKYILISCLAVTVSTLSSCNKCVECGDCPSGITLSETEFCKDDFASKEEYDQAVAVVEAFGCDCK